MVDETGRVTLSGVLSDPLFMTLLQFRWVSDTSQMKAMRQEVEQNLTEFPVKESSGEETGQS